MKILYLNHNVVRRGGTFYRAFHIARHLVSSGHSVTLVTISVDRRWGFTRELADGVEIVHTPDLLGGVGRSGWDLWDAAGRIAFLRGTEWNIVHAWDCRPAVILPALYARACSHRLNGKLVIDWCDWWGRGGVQAERPASWFKRLYAPVETFFEEAFRTTADATTVASDALRRRALALGVSPRHVLLLPGGSDSCAVRPLDAAMARKTLGLPHQGFIVGYMGALPAAEVELLLDSVRAARAVAPDLSFLAVGVSIAGTGKSLREFAGRRWAEWMVETGRVPLDRVAVCLSACDALVLVMRPTVSNCARWPSKLNDYLSSGRPVVATRVGDSAEFLERHKAGLWAEDNSASIARQLLRLRSDPQEAEAIGSRGRRLAEGELSWPVLVKRLSKLYASVAEDRQPNAPLPAH